MPGPDNENIRDFWSWFSTIEVALRSLNPGDPLWADLDQRVSSLRVGGWEIGPAIASEAKFMFAISPRGDPAKYVLCREVVAQAPRLPEWEIYPAKPRKLWRRRFRWSKLHIDLDASGWRFTVDRHEDGQCEVVLVGDVLATVPPREQQKVLEFVLESELGEAHCMEKLCGLEINRNPSAADQKRALPITELFAAVSHSALNS